MLLQKINISIILILITARVFSQTEIDNNILLTGSDSTVRQIENLGIPLTLNSALRLEDLKYGKYNFAQSSGADTINLIFENPISRLSDGDLFFFNVTGLNTQPILLSIGNMDTLIPLMINDVDSVGINKLFVGQTVGAIFFNYKAFIITPVQRNCPTGLVKVNNNYCIEINDRPAAYFFDAITDCIGDNLELCSAGNWYFACSNRTPLGINNMLDNYEWLDDAANDVLQVRTLGGGGTCGSQSIYYGDAIMQKYRCCYILR